MTSTGPLVISAGAVVLRDIRLSDVDDVYAIVGDQRVTQWLSFNNRNHAETASMIEGIITRARQSPRTEYYLGIADVESDRILGFARLGFSGVKAAKLGYAMSPPHQGKGLATLAVGALIRYGFCSLDLHRITAAVGPANTASTSVLHRLGFRSEGRLRDHVFTNGEWRDSLLFSLLETDSLP